MRRSAREDVVAKHLRLVRTRIAALDAGRSADPAALQDARLVELGLARLLPELWGIAPSTGRPVADGVEAQVLAEIRSSTAVLVLQAQEPDAPPSGHPGVAEALYRYAHTDCSGSIRHCSARRRRPGCSASSRPSGPSGRRAPDRRRRTPDLATRTPPDVA